MKTILIVLVSLPLAAGAQNRGAGAMNAAGAPATATQSQVQSATGTQLGTQARARDGSGAGAQAGFCAGATAAGAVGPQASCPGGGAGPRVGVGMRHGPMAGRGAGYLLAIPAGTVTTLTAAQLVAAVEEERVAHDLYAAALAKWSLRPFAQISTAETRHDAALTQLAVSSGMTVPPAATGTYATAELQAFYASVLPLMSESETAALGAGAFVEETDIAGLRRLLATECDDVTRRVLTNLEAASRTHLVAFVNNLAVRGVTYAPKVLTAEEYAAIIGG